MSFDGDVTQRLSAVAEDVSSEDAERVYQAVKHERGRRRRRALAFGAGVATAVVAISGLSTAGVLSLGNGENQEGAASSEIAAPGEISDFQTLQVEDGKPCADGVAVPLAELATTFPGIWEPDHELAATSNLRQAWLCGGAPLLKYDQIEIYFEEGWNLEDPEARWSAMAEQWGAGHVATVHGVPAFVLPRGDMGPLGQVSLVLDSTYIRIHGDGNLPVERLVEVAETLKQPGH